MGKYTRRSVLLTAAGLAGGSALAGCGLGGSPSGGNRDGASNILTVWFPGTNTAEIELVTNKIAPKFQTDTGTSVQVTFLDYPDLSAKLNAAFAAGTAPDVFGHGPAAVADFVANQRLEDLTAYVGQFSEKDRTDMAAGLPGGQINGIQYLMPLSMQGLLVAYNAADLSKAGLNPDRPPTTWEEVTAAARELTQRKGGQVTHSGLILPSHPVGLHQSFAALIAAAGGRQLSEDGRQATFNSDQGATALQYIVDAYNGAGAVAGGLGTDLSTRPPAQSPLVTGAASMLLTQPNLALQMQKAAPRLDLRVLPPLTLADASAAASFGGPGPGLMINADSPNKELSWKFISYLLSTEVAAEYTETTSALPLRASASASSYVKDSDILQTYLKAAPNWVPNPNVPAWVQVRDTMAKNFEQATNQRVDVKAALAQAAADVDAILAKNK